MLRASGALQSLGRPQPEPRPQQTEVKRHLVERRRSGGGKVRLPESPVTTSLVSRIPSSGFETQNPEKQSLPTKAGYAAMQAPPPGLDPCPGCGPAPKGQAQLDVGAGAKYPGKSLYPRGSAQRLPVNSSKRLMTVSYMRYSRPVVREMEKVLVLRGPRQ